MFHLFCLPLFKASKITGKQSLQEQKKMHRNNFWPYGYFVFILCTKAEKKREKFHLLIASTNCSKKLRGNRGSDSSRKNILSAPVTTCMSSHWLSSKFSFSSGKTRGEMEQLVLMKQLQDTNYYVNVCLLSSATVNSLLHLEVWCCACFFFFLFF